MRPTVVLNIAGLTRALLGKMSRLSAFAHNNQVTPVRPAFPALASSAQASFLTGLTPAQHGIVGNGWYDRDLAEVHFWKPSNRLIHGPKLWDKLRARDASFTCAQVFWQHSSDATADISVARRLLDPADGRGNFDIETWPFSLRPELQKDIGEFPSPQYWGPETGIASSSWIADAAHWIEEKYRPTLSLVRLPHLTYNLQRHGPNSSNVEADLRLIDNLAADLIDFFRKREVQIAIISDHGTCEVDKPVHLNRLFRKKGWLAIETESELETLDCGASKVFAVADHQIAHVYLNDASLESQVRELIEAQSDIDLILDRNAQVPWDIRHPRSGDFVVMAGPRSWFTYYYWENDDLAPDFARTVDPLHKPGYDPVELFTDPHLRWPQLRVAASQLKEKLGLRGTLRATPLDATLVHGSHGRTPESEDDWPVLLLEKHHPMLDTESGPSVTGVHFELLRYINPYETTRPTWH